MGVLSLVHAPGRYANLRRIRSLDPEVDHDEILRLTARLEFPWDYSQGTGTAFMRDYGVPDDELAYVLATTVVGAVRWIEDYGWRRLDPIELAAITKVSTRFGELMGLRGLPTTYDGYLALLVDFEHRHFAHTPAATRLAEASIRIARDLAPAPLRPLVRRVTIAVMDEPLREALGLPRQPTWFVRAVRGGLRLRGRLLRLAPPRRTAYAHRPTTYPHGHRLEDLGPLSMLDQLNASAHREGSHA